MAQSLPLTLDSTMVHEIPRGRARAGGEEVILSDNFTALDAPTDRFIREQMLQPFLPTGRPIIEEAMADGELRPLIPRLAREVLNEPRSLPQHSRDIASHLFTKQTGSASAGIFLAANATWNGVGRLVLLKAEHQEGVRLRHAGGGQHVSFHVEHITELIVGRNSKVYKIAMLWLRESDDRLVGAMVDKQNGHAWADYFLAGFLEMGLQHPSEVLTRDFVEAAVDHINNAPELTPEKRTRYTTALSAVLDSPSPQIDPNSFIRDFVDPADRDDFANALPAQARVAFQKDTTLVQSQVGGLLFGFGQGEVELRATRQAVESGRVKVEADGPEGPRVVVDGQPDRIVPSRAPR